MTVFHFRLATLLKLRQDVRRQRQREFAQAQDAERILLQQAADVAAEINGTKARVRTDSSPGELPIDRLLELQRYALQLKARALLVGQQVATVREEVERRRQALLEADRRVRMLEKLRDRQIDEHRRAGERREQKAVDEAGQQGFVLKLHAERE